MSTGEATSATDALDEAVDMLGSDAGSSSVASTMTGGNSLTGAKNRFFDGCRFIGFQTLRRPLPGHGVFYLFFAVQLLQMVSFALDPGVLFPSSARGTQFSAAPGEVRVLLALRYLRAFDRYSLAALIVCLVPLVAMAACFFVQLFLVWRGNLGVRRTYTMLRWLDAFLPAAAPLMLSAFLMTFVQVGSSSGAIVAMVFASIGTLLLLAQAFMHAVFFVDFRPSWSRFSVAMPYTGWIWAASRLALVVSDAFLSGNLASGVSTLRITLHALVVLLLLGVTFAGFAGTQPFFWRALNTTHNIVLGSVSLAALVSFIASFVADSADVALFITAFVCLLPGGAIGYGIGRVWRVLLRKRAALVLAAPDHSKALPPFAWTYDLVARDVYAASPSQRGAAADRAEVLYNAACLRFQQSALVAIWQSTFLVEIRQNMQLMRKRILRVKHIKPRFDVDYLAFCVSMSGTTSRSDKADDTEFDLTMARLHHSAAKKKMAEFWGRVAKVRGLADPEQLLSAVSSLDHHEQTAEGIFRKLVGDDPNNVSVLRAYAMFLSDIKDGQEQAHALFQAADDIEDMQAQAERRRRLRHHHGAAAQSTVKFGESVVVTVAAEEEGGTVGAEHQRLSEVEDEDKRSRASFESSASAAEAGVSEARAKILQYQNRISSSKSRATRNLKIVLLLSFALMLASGITVFVVSYIAAQQMYQSSLVVHASTEVMHRLQEDMFKMRGLEWGKVWATNKNVQDTLAVLQEHWAIVQADSRNWDSLNTMIPLRIYSPNNATQNATYFTTNSTLWASLMKALGSVQELAYIFDTNSSLVNDLERHPAWRFLLDNLIDEITPVTYEYIYEQTTKDTSRQAFETTSVITLFPLSALILALVSGALYIPSIRKINEERRMAISLFSDLPKSTCLNMAHNLTTEAEKLEEKYKSGKVAVADNSTGVVRRISWLYIVASLLLFLFGAAVLCTLIVVSSSNSAGAVTYAASVRYQSFIEMGFLTNELLDVDTTTWSRGSLLARYVLSRDAFKEMNEKLKLVYHEGSLSAAMEELLYERPCPGDMKCNGLLELMEHYLQMTDAFMTVDPSQQTEENYIHKRIVPAYQAARTWFQERVETNLAAALVSSNVLQAVTIVALVCEFVVVLFVYVSSRSLISSLETETKRGFLLLLRLPLNVLQSIESVRSFLEEGFTDFQASAEALVEEQEQRTKVILDASKDAVITMNEKLQIAQFNPAAEALLGYATEDVLGKSFVPLLEKDTAEKFQDAVEEFLAELNPNKAKKRRHKHRPTTGSAGQQKGKSVSEASHAKKKRKKRSFRAQFHFGEGETELRMLGKDGTVINVLMSVATSVSRDGVVFAVFAKDIRSMKEHEDELKRERRRADLLLKNILPEAVAETLKRNPGQTVAQKYESVTVLFADIVEFTPKAAGMEPSALVAMLNGIFSSWDELCVEHGIEKVKTIGDCYMAACGVPVRRPDHAKRMVEFAVAALASLAEYNAAHPDQPQIQMRIGINTGPVVAGVIGKTKFQFDLWGDAVNTASRIETAGLPNRIQVSESTFAATREFFEFECRGKIALKGKGEQEAYLLKTTASTSTSRPASKSQRPRTGDLLSDDLFGLIAESDPAKRPGTSKDSSQQ